MATAIAQNTERVIPPAAARSRYAWHAFHRSSIIFRESDSVTGLGKFPKNIM